MNTELPPLTLGIYQHYKGPKYQVLGLCRHSESEEVLVVYKALYGDFGLWVRPFSLFTEEVNGQPRFALIQALEASHDTRH